MRAQSAIRAAVTVIPRTVTVAAGVFAAGHLGELTRHLPFELVDAVLAETRTVQRRLRRLPSRVGLYFVLALGLFPGLGYGKVWNKLVAALDSGMRVCPSDKALRDLRRRLGPAPLRALFEVVAGPLAQPHTAGVRFGRYRTVAFDGCASIKVPDSGPNVSWLGKQKASHGVTGYPALELMTLVETGTRALIGASFGPRATSETDYARGLLHLLQPDMLVLADRGFDATAFLQDVAATGARLLIRLRNNRRPPVLTRLDNGDYLTRLGTLTLRIITANITVTCADGTHYHAQYQLGTTLLDHRRYRASVLIALYHQRWEHELTYLALRHTLLTGRVLRSADPSGLTQEIWALLTLYQLLRIAMLTAVESQPGTDPDRAGFTTAAETAKDLLINARNITDEHTDLVGDIGRAVLANLLPPRRPRVSLRKVKSPLSRYHNNDPHRPHKSTTITNLDITTNDPQPSTTHQQPLTTARSP